MKRKEDVYSLCLLSLSIMTCLGIDALRRRTDRHQKPSYKHRATLSQSSEFLLASEDLCVPAPDTGPYPDVTSTRKLRTRATSSKKHFSSVLFHANEQCLRRKAIALSHSMRVCQC
jgi:hypothetical protein